MDEFTIDPALVTKADTEYGQPEKGRGRKRTPGYRNLYEVFSDLIKNTTKRTEDTDAQLAVWREHEAAYKNAKTQQEKSLS